MAKTDMTVGEILRRVAKAKESSIGFHNSIKKRRRLYDGEHYNYKPRAGEHQYVDPSYGNVVDIATAMLMANGVEFTAKSWSPLGDSTKMSSHIEKMLSGIIAINEEREEASLRYTTGFNFNRDGCAVLYSIWDNGYANMNYQKSIQVMNDKKEVESKEGYLEVPITLKVIDPLEVYLVPGRSKRWSEIIHIEERSIYDVETEYGVSFQRYEHLTDAFKMDETVEVVDYWREIRVESTTRTEYEDGDSDVDTSVENLVQHAVVADSIFLEKFCNMEDYSDIPYTIQFFKPTNPKDRKSNKWFTSIIDPMVGPITQGERLTNRRLRQIDTYTSLPLVVQSIRKLQLDPAMENSVLNINHDEDIRFPAWNGNPPDIDKQLQMFDRHAQESSFPSSMFGEGPSTVSGYALSQMTDQGRIRLEQPVEHLQLMWRVWAKKVLRLLASKADGKVMRVYGKARGADFYDQIFIKDFADFQIQSAIRPEFPNDEVRKHGMAMQAAGFLSEETILQKYFNIEQPDDEQILKIQESINKNPQLQNYIIMHELQQRMTSGDPVATMLYEQFLTMSAGAGAPSGNAPAPAGAKPPQALGGPGPDGVTPQEMGGQPDGQQPGNEFSAALSSVLGG